MKKLLLILILICSIFSYNKVNTYCEDDLNLNGEYALVIEAKTKRIIYEKNKDKKWYPASMTKMMGMLLILEKIHKEEIRYDDLVTISSYSASMGGSQIYLSENEVISVNDLFKSVAINSANDAIVALGEYAYYSSKNFVNQMNKKAQELKMLNTHFVNETGFHDENHYSTCYDMALLAAELVKYDDEILKYSSLKEDYIRKDTQNPFWLVNTNKLLGNYEGLDGLKTGFTSQSNYNLTATCKRNDIRLISVVMNEDSIKNRSQDTIRLLDYAYAKIKNKTLFKKDTQISNYKLKQGQILSLVAKEDINLIMFKNELDEDIHLEIVLNNISLPISKDDIVGVLNIKINDFSLTYPLYSECNMSSYTFFYYLLKYLKAIFF